MKKILVYGMLLAGWAFASCQYESVEQAEPAQKTVRLQVTVDGIGTGLQVETRATVDAVAGEENVNDLYLLFFSHSAGRTGTFVKAYHVGAVAPAQLGSPFDLQIGTGEGTGLSHSENYSILAFANLDNYTGVSAFLGGLTDQSTEGEVMKKLIDLPGVVSVSGLPMSGRTTKMASQELVQLNLTRAVVRLDVQNTLKDFYELTSVAIYSAAEKSYLWTDDLIAGQSHTGRFYGVGDSGSAAAIDANGNVTGGLYVFENFEGDPSANPATTTALVVGLSPKTASGTIGTVGTTTYYRIPIRPEESAQSIKRNNVYKVSIRGVLAVGKGSENAAVDGSLEVTINNWNLDDEGMVVTDGQSTMAVPSKYIRFGPETETRTYTIFTFGEGTLSITRSDLPNGLTAQLSGNTLTVTATALPAGADERSGTFELGFGGLRGTVQVIQSPDDDKYLKLNRSTLPIYDAVGGAGVNGISDGGKVEVSASHPWTARIYNTSTHATNPGFSFADGSVKESWDSDTDGNVPLDVFITGSNPDNDVRRGFIVFSLKGFSEYRQVLVLSQDSKAQIRIAPNYTALPFDKEGMPTSTLVAVTDDYYEIAVSPGASSGGATREWTAELTGADAARFEVTKIDGDNPRVFLTAKGTHAGYPGLNLGPALSASLKISLAGISTPVAGEHYFELPITQAPWTFTVKRTGPLTRVPVTGTKVGDSYTAYVEYEVDIPSALQWDAEITDYSHGSSTKAWKIHKGYFVSESGQKEAGETLTGQSSTQKIRVGFDKIYYPLVHWDDDENIPQVTVKVNISGFTDAQIAPVQVYPEQEPLVAKEMNIRDLNSYSYGALTGSASHYLDYYYAYLTNTTMFGTSGTVRTATNPDITSTPRGISNVPSSVSSDYGYVHVGGRPNVYDTGDYYTQPRHTVANDWWSENDGVIVYAADPRSDLIFHGSTASNKFETVLSQLGYEYELPRDGSGFVCKINPDTDVQGTRVMQYLLQYGPFRKIVGGTATQISTAVLFDRDNANTSVKLSSIPSGAVPVILNQYDQPFLVVDPKNRLVYWGESNMFHDSNSANPFSDAPVEATGATSSDKSKFLANLIAFIINTAQYGSHFTDLFDESIISDTECSFLNE